MDSIQSDRGAILAVNSIINQGDTRPKERLNPPLSLQLTFEDGHSEQVEISKVIGYGDHRVALELSEERVLLIRRTYTRHREEGPELAGDEGQEELPATIAPCVENVHIIDEGMRSAAVASKAFKEANLLTCDAKLVTVCLQRSSETAEPFLGYVSENLHHLAKRNIFTIVPNSMNSSQTWRSGGDYNLSRIFFPREQQKSFFPENSEIINIELWKPLLSQFIDDLVSMCRHSTIPAKHIDSSDSSTSIAVITDQSGKVTALRPLFFDKILLSEDHFITPKFQLEHLIYNSVYALLTNETLPSRADFEELRTNLATYCINSLNERLQPTPAPTPKSPLPLSTWERICDWVHSFFAWIGSFFTTAKEPQLLTPQAGNAQSQ